MSKLNPQKATAYVGPGVLRKGGKITPVPNGPLVKKKGPFKGSTLKAGGVIKKAQNGDSLSPYMKKRAEADVRRAEIAKKRSADTQKVMNAKGFSTVEELRSWTEKNNKKSDVKQENIGSAGSSQKSSSKGGAAKAPCKGGICTGLNIKSRNGSMIKRADGSMSKRGLWDNIRANKGSGKKPTKQMLVQEKKIKAKAKK